MGHTHSFLQNISVTSPEFFAVVGTILGYAAWRLYRLLSFVYMTPLRVLPGPPVPSLVYGNLNEFGEVEGSFLPDQLFVKYGKNYVDREFFMVSRAEPILVEHRRRTHEHDGDADTASLDVGFPGDQPCPDALYGVREAGGDRPEPHQELRQRCAITRVCSSCTANCMVVLSLGILFVQGVQPS